MSYAADVQRNERFHRELMHRVDLAGRHAFLLPLLVPGGCPGGVFEIRMTFLTPTPKPRNSITSDQPGLRSRTELVQAPADHAAADGRADQMAEDAAGRSACSDRRCTCAGSLASACCKRSSRLSSDSSRASGGSFGTSSVSSSAMSSPLCVAPAEIRASTGRGTWRKATPPRRRPFMNGGVDSQPRAPPPVQRQ